jgi:hypothetical protein
MMVLTQIMHALLRVLSSDVIASVSEAISNCLDCFGAAPLAMTGEGSQALQ